jgi:hypothetical protein
VVQTAFLFHVVCAVPFLVRSHRCCLHHAHSHVCYSDGLLFLGCYDRLTLRSCFVFFRMDRVGKVLGHIGSSLALHKSESKDLLAENADSASNDDFFAPLARDVFMLTKTLLDVSFGQRVTPCARLLTSSAVAQVIRTHSGEASAKSIQDLLQLSGAYRHSPSQQNFNVRLAVLFPCTHVDVHHVCVQALVMHVSQLTDREQLITARAFAELLCGVLSLPANDC